MQSEIATHQAQIKKRQQELKQIDSELAESEKAVADAALKLDKTQKQQQSSQKALKALSLEQRALERKIAQQKKILAQQAESAFRSDDQGPIQLLLNQQDPAKTNRTLEFYAYLNAARIEAITALKRNNEKLAQQKSAAKKVEQQLQQLAAEQKREQQQLVSSQKEQIKNAEALEHALHNDEQKLARLKKSEQALKAKLEALRRKQEEKARREKAKREQLARERAEAKRKAQQERKKAKEEGKRLPPEPKEVDEPIEAENRYQAGLKTSTAMNWPVQGEVLIPYGAKRTAELRWKGTLIGAPEGTPVKSVAPGEVVFADWLEGFGMLLVVDHGKGYMSLYGYNQTLLRKEGDRVEQGEPVALVGKSGGQERAALYFEIRYQGEAINPTQWLKKR